MQTNTFELEIALRVQIPSIVDSIQKKVHLILENSNNMKIIKAYGLIGYPLTHSFSKKYFLNKFKRFNITDSSYELYEIKNLEHFDQKVMNIANLKGLNVTIPHKETIIPFLTKMSPVAQRIGAVNTLKINNKAEIMGYNSDYHGFKSTLLKFIPHTNIQALILGTGGASKAVGAVLEDLNMTFQFVSRSAKKPNYLTYQQITPSIIQKHQLIINTTPLGMFPHITSFPVLPYTHIGSEHYLYDLIYNPENTLFMQKGLQNGASVINGLPMLKAQAEKSWQIWNAPSHAV